MSLNPDYGSNPYNPTFGTPPTSYIHRFKEESMILNEFCAADDMPKSYMIVGTRGMGKTVLMHELANRFEDIAEWVVIRMNPNLDMMDSFMRKLSGHAKAAPVIRSAKINLSFFSIGVDMKTSQIRDTEDAITEIVRGLKKAGKRVLVIVDEATNTESMKAFASAYQNLIGQRLPVYLLMTGLYENINSLKNEDNLTFLYRMPRIQLGPLKLSEIAANYKDAFELDDRTAFRMASFTKGYSYAFQLLGKLTWDNEGSCEYILDEYRADLYEMVYEKIWDEMSERDREFAHGAAKSEDGKIGEIREILGWKTNEISPYRDRLVKKGIMTIPRYGHVELTLPYFKGFVLDNYGFMVEEEALPYDL